MATVNNQSSQRDDAKEKAFRNSRSGSGAGLTTEGSSVEDPDQEFDEEKMESTADRDTKKDTGQQVRGHDLKQKMIDSAKEGETYRAEHQGPDQRASAVGGNALKNN